MIASSGQPGEGGKRSGADGEDMVLEVPLGTIARNAETNELILEITEEGQEIILTPGGKGGFDLYMVQADGYIQP